MSSRHRRFESGWRSAALALALALALLSVPSAGRAEPSDGFVLSVTPDAEGCTTEASLRARLARLRVRAAAAGVAVRLDASLPQAELEVLRGGVIVATRQFDTLPAPCGERLETLAVVIALAIEHAIEPPEPVEPPEAKPAPQGDDAGALARREASEAAAARAAQTPAPDEPGVQTEARAEARSEPALLTVIGAGGAFGLLPELAGVASVGIELPSRGVRLGLAALFSTQTSSAVAGGTAQAQLAGARGVGCVYGDAARLDVHACAGLTLGVVMGSGSDYASTERATGTLLAPLIKLGARFPAHAAFSLGVALEGFVHVVRPELQVSGRAGGEVSVPPVGAALSLEGVLALP